MSLIQRINDLATRTATEFKTLRAELAASGATPARRHRIFNPAFQISQLAGINVSYNNPAGGGMHVADGWYFGNGSNVPVAWSWGTSGNPFGKFQLLFNSQGAGAPSLNSYVNVRHAIEGTDIADLSWGTLSAQPVVLRILAVLNHAGEVGLSLTNADATRCYVTNLAFSTAEANTWKEFVIVVPGCTDGTWDTGRDAGIFVRFGMAVHANIVSPTPGWKTANFGAVTGVTNMVSAIGRTFALGRVELYAGNKLPVWEMPDYDTVLRKAEVRYEVTNESIYGGHSALDGYGRASVRWRQTKRIVPTVTFGSGSVVTGAYMTNADGGSYYAASNHCIIAAGTIADARTGLL